MPSTMNSSDVPLRGAGLTFEEMTEGLKFRTAARTITDADLANFLQVTGINEPLFLDAVHAKESGYTGRLVPGALTYTFAEGLILQTNALHGTGLAFMHMDLDVRAPVYVGDTIHAVVEVTESRKATRGNRGVVTTTVTILNQRDEIVQFFEVVRLIRGRDFETS